MTKEIKVKNLPLSLKTNKDNDDKKLSLKDLVEKYQDEITDLCKYDKVATASFGTALDHSRKVDWS